MKTLLTYLGSALLGYLLARAVKDYKDKFSWTGRLLAIVVTSLVFSMGLKIGSNEEVIGNLGQIGIYGLLFCYLPLGMTILALNITRRIMGYDHEGKPKNNDNSTDASIKDGGNTKPNDVLNQSEGEGAVQSPKVPFYRTSSFRYLIAVLMGFFIGYFGVIKQHAIDPVILNSFLGTYITIALLVMVFLVGMDMGFDTSGMENALKIGWRVLIFPVVTGLATLATGLIIGIFMPLSTKEVLAITCTFCWYSLAPNIIINAGYVTAGAIAFLANFLRVLTSLITIPIVAKRVGWIETVGMSVAAAMDVCIGTITEATDKTIAVYAFVSGVVYTVLIPLLVPLIVG